MSPGHSVLLVGWMFLGIVLGCILGGVGSVWSVGMGDLNGTSCIMCPDPMREPEEPPRRSRVRLLKVLGRVAWLSLQLSCLRLLQFSAIWTCRAINTVLGLALISK